MIRYVWVFYILGYDASRQNRLLYAPIKVTIREVRRGYAMLWFWTKRGFAHLFNFQSLGSFISIKGFLVSFIVLSLLALIVKLAISVGNRLLKWWPGPTDDSAGLTAGILFYRRLAQMLAVYELERTPPRRKTSSLSARLGSLPGGQPRSRRWPRCRRRSSRRFTGSDSATATSIRTLSKNSRRTSTCSRASVEHQP